MVGVVVFLFIFLFYLFFKKIIILKMTLTVSSHFILICASLEPESSFF